jgi:hypothetical protein
MARASAWVVAIALLAVTGCTNTDSSNENNPRQPRRCFSAHSVRNFRVVNNSTVNIRVNRDVYRLDLFGSCTDLNWNSRMGLQTTGSSTICVGSGLGTTIVTRGPTGGRQRCPVQSVTLLTPEQVEALPPRERP